MKCNHLANEINIRTHFLGGLSTQLPASSIPGVDLAAFSDLKLVDPGFSSPGPIDIIIGSDYYGQIIINKIIRGENPGLFAQNTIFGWVIMGPVRIRARYSPRTFHAISTHQDQNLQNLLTRFWVQEEITSIHTSSFSPEEEACEAHFKSTHTRDSMGRYNVRLPLLKSPDQLGDSFKPVIRCLHHLMGYLNKDARLKALYTEFMAEYINLNHMVPANSSSDRTQYFLPHHGVLKKVNNQYKIRVVFNGSKPTSSGLSLNDIMHTGSKLQVNIFYVLLKSRQHRYIFITDVAKMFRQIRVHEDDQHLQQILWFDQDGNITPFKLTTVTYGTKSAPYLAVRALLQLYKDEGHRFPLTIKPLTEGRYIDDISGGADDLDSLQQVADQIEALCMAGEFPLAKWASNHDELRQLDHTEAITQYKIEDPEASIKILGLYWSPISDHFSFKHSPPSSINACTKRSILSEIAQIFDPLRFLSPPIIQAKMFMQELWLVKLSWYTPLPDNLCNR